jgi:hypothetical protein
VEGKVIYHAGDLNWWHWNGEPDEDNVYYKETFLKEMKYLEGKEIDVAFMLLDPRQEDKYCLGMNYSWSIRRQRQCFRCMLLEHIRYRSIIFDAQTVKNGRDCKRDHRAGRGIFPGRLIKDLLASLGGRHPTLVIYGNHAVLLLERSGGGTAFFVEKPHAFLSFFDKVFSGTFL